MPFRKTLAWTAPGMLTALVLVELGILLANLLQVWNLTGRWTPALTIFGPLTLLGGTLATGMWLRGHKMLWGLHPATWLSPVPAFVVLLWLQEYRGFQIPLPEPPLDSLLVLCLTAALIEGRIRREGRLLFRTRAIPHLVFAGVLTLFVALQFAPGIAYFCTMAPGGCATAPTYGFPMTVFVGSPSGLHLWDDWVRLALNLASVLIMLAATGYVLEGLLPRAEVPRRQRLADWVPFLAYAALCVALTVPMLDWPGQIRILFHGLAILGDPMMGTRVLLRTGLWALLFLIGATGLIRAIVAEHGPLFHLLKAAVTPLPPLPVASPSGKAQI